MELNEKLQELRKQKGLTQEELAAALFVSRTAVSKWESGRGCPNIDSLKALAKFFGVTVDALLSGDALLSIAEADNRQSRERFRDLVFGLLDCSCAMFFFLPFFGQKTNGTVTAVSLLSLTGITPYLRTAYFAAVTAIALWGILTLALQNCRHGLWTANKNRLSLAFNAAAALLFMSSMQPYAAAFSFILLLIKVLLTVKWQ
ncbi:MAG: helix-turn-helix transcriptional regulator [Clostridia bacterium]|nr:helix-turn-helix transcriptional regulator [Clostridia bacterium]